MCEHDPKLFRAVLIALFLFWVCVAGIVILANVGKQNFEPVKTEVLR